MGEPYRRYRTFYQDISGNFNVLAGTTGVTALTTVRSANHTIFLQKIHTEITAGSGGKTWTIQDDAGTPIKLVPSLDASAIAHTDIDFGPNGIPLTQGQSLTLSVSAAGAVGWVSWEGYQKLTGANVAAASTN